MLVLGSSGIPLDVPIRNMMPGGDFEGRRQEVAEEFYQAQAMVDIPVASQRYLQFFAM